MGLAHGRQTAMVISGITEATYGTALDLNAGASKARVLYNRGASTAVRETDLFDTSTLAMGYEEPYNYMITRYRSEPVYDGPAQDITLPIFASAALGTDALSTPAGATTARQHLIVPVSAGTELPSRTVWVGLTGLTTTTAGEYLEFPGCVVNRFSLSGDVNTDNGAMRVVANMTGSGGVATQAAAVGTTANNIIFSMGGLYHAIGTSGSLTTGFPANVDLPNDAGAAPAWGEFTVTAGYGYTPVSPYLVSFDWTVDNAIDPGAGFTAGADLTASARYRDKRTQTITCTYLWTPTALAETGDGDANVLRDLHSDIGNDVALAFCNVHRTIIATGDATDYRYGWSLYVPKATIGRVEMSKDSGIVKATVTYNVNDSGVSGCYSSHFYSWNGDDVDYVS